MAIMPPALSSAVYARDLDEVRRLGACTSAERAADEAIIAPALLDIDIDRLYRQFADWPGRTLVQNARLQTLV